MASINLLESTITISTSYSLNSGSRLARRVQASDLPPEMRQEFDLLCDEDFKMCTTTFLFDLAGAIFENQQGNPVVHYSHATDSTSWKSSFFGPDYSSQFLRDACPLIRSGNTHQFKHRSLLEYLYAVTVYDLINNASFPLLPNFVDHPLSRISLSDHQMTIKLLADRVPQDSSFKDRLIAMLEESKTFSTASMAASNAITILVKSGMRFNSADLRTIKIRGANLTEGEFDSADLRESDLTDVILDRCWLRNARFEGSSMKGARFGELPAVDLRGMPSASAYSRNTSNWPLATGMAG
ncbi:hypothetical protein BGX23_012796 [Mortierella sp. AD031]|nr:hypothetical protein BGX23_012796 [Mortierella sp. AD031]